MNENLDLTKILDGCPVGTKFYSSVYGEVSFAGIDVTCECPIKVTAHNISMGVTVYAYYTRSGRSNNAYDGECTLFPSKDQRDWSKFERFWDKPKVERFDPKTFQLFDKILTRDCPSASWRIELFSSKKDENNLIKGLTRYWYYAIPCNGETKHLVDTTNDCPEYYKWWEK